MLTDGLKLMITGMGTVFIFLAMMIFIINILSRSIAFFTYLLGEKQTVCSNTSGNRYPENSSAEDSAIITAIVTAVHKFREKRQI